MAESPLTNEEIRDGIQNVDDLWTELFPGQQARIVGRLVQGVVVEERGVTVTFRANGLRSLALEAQGREDAPIPYSDDAITIAIAMQFKRRGGRNEIIVPQQAEPVDEIFTPPQEPLMALAQARQLQDMLDAGKYDTVAALAKRMKVSTAYAARILRLNYLAPDIVKAILDGREPSGLSLTQLIQPLPSVWSEQRAQRGFTA